MDQAKKLHQILYTEIRRVPKGQIIFLGELIGGGGDQPPWPSWTEGMLAPYDCIVYERSEKMLDDRVVAWAERVECDPKHTPLPWSFVERSIFVQRGTEDQKRVAVTEWRGIGGTSNAVDNAEFIVLACNAHYELLEALVEARKEIALARFGEAARLGLDYHEFVKREWGGVDPKLEKMDSAIAKATRAGVVTE